MALSIFKPQISRVARGLEGKSLLIWGQNRVGKTSVTCRLPKPVVLCMEDGVNAINGVPFFKILDWKDYVQFVKEITDPKNSEQAHEMYQTIIIDQIEALGDLCGQYVCTKFGVQTIGEQLVRPDGKVDGRFNGYKELDAENKKWLRKLILSGFTVVYIGHEGSREIVDEQGNKYTKLYPRGDKRIVDAICDAVDIIAYARPNGMDENGREVKSSLYMVNTKQFLAGSRFDYLAPYLPAFTPEALENAVADAVKKQEEVEGFKAVSFAEQKETKEVAPAMDTAEVKQKIQQIAAKYVDAEKCTLDPRVTEIIEEYLGKGAKISAATKEQHQQLEMVLFDLERLDTAPMAKKSYEDIRNQIMEAATRLNNEERMDEYREIVEKHLGKGVKVSTLGPEETDKMEAVLNDLKQLLKQVE